MLKRDARTQNITEKKTFIFSNFDGFTTLALYNVYVCIRTNLSVNGFRLSSNRGEESFFLARCVFLPFKY